MIDVGVLPAFIAVILLFLLPPGPDMAYMLAVGLQGGRRAAVAAILGIGTAMSVYATAVVLGLGQIAQSHPHLLNVIKVLGVAYLLWLAFSTIRTARTTASDPGVLESGRWYLRGFAIAATNPKIILFYLAVLPGFTGDADHPVAQFALLGAVNVASEVLLYGSIGILAGGFHNRFNRARRGNVTLSYIAASVYAVLACVIAVETAIS